ncbi:MAG: hypothetical protein WCL44_06290 [bacterium]
MTVLSPDNKCGTPHSRQGAAAWITYSMLTATAACCLCPGCRDSTAHGKLSIERYKQAGQRIETAAAAINQVLTAKRVAPETATLAPRRKFATSSQQGGWGDNVIEFRLTGIAGNRSSPLVLTSAGTAGLGEEIRGLTVVEIGEDTVTFADKHGHKTTVRLYKENQEP